MKKLIMIVTVLVVGAVLAGPALAGVQSFTFQQGDANAYSGAEDGFLRWGAAPGDGSRNLFHSCCGEWWNVQFGATNNVVVGLSAGRQGVGIMRFNDVFGGGAGQIPLGSNVVSAELMLHVNQTNADTLRASPFFTALSTFGAGNEVPAADGEPSGHYAVNGTVPVDWAVPCTLNSINCGPVDAQMGLGASDYDSGDAAASSGVEGAVQANKIVIDVTALVQAGYLTNDPVTGAQGNGAVIDNPNLTVLTLLMSERTTLGERPLLTVTVPEPATFGLLAVGCVLVGMRRR